MESIERRAAFRTILNPLVIGMRADFDTATWRVYFAALQDIPDSVLAAAVTALIQEDRQFMPKPGEIRKAAEQARLKLLQAVPYTGCEDCGGTGWRTLEARTVSRCPCKQAYLERLSSMELGPPLLKAITAGEGDAA
jgi:hypothetical protein